jgi:hypothetical protein
VLRLSLLSVLIAMGVAVSADPPAKMDKEKAKRPTTPEEFEALAKEGPKPPWMPFANQTPVRVNNIDGTVMKVTTESIKIRLKGSDDTATFPPHSLLATGAVCHWEHDATCYLLDDVKVGDEVILGIGTVGKGKPECFYLSIRWRPEEKVPASRKPSEPNPYHKRQQYQNEYDDRGEHTPEELRTHEEKKQFCEKRGLPPPPPLKPKTPRAKPNESTGK